nr:glycosyltransferase family 2 protein [Rhodoplanes tepidamans]
MPAPVVPSPRALLAATTAHLRARGTRAEVTPGRGALLPCVHVIRKAAETDVTVIVPTRDRHDLLRRCLDSIAPAVARANGRILVLDNETSDPATLDYLAGLPSRHVAVMRITGPFNFARLNNIAVAASGGPHLCLLNDDVEARDADWLGEMLSRLADPTVGAVGALLSWPSGVVQHGGIVLGPAFRAAHAFHDRLDGDPGYGDLLRVAHDCSAVTAACLLTRRADWEAVGGMDEIAFPVNFNDVDYCLKLRAAGRRIVMTPHARLWHRESSSRGRDDRPDRAARYERELRMLRSRWGEALAADPFYSPVLSLDPVPYAALAWPPRDRRARTAQAPVPADMPDGF